MKNMQKMRFSVFLLVVFGAVIETSINGEDSVVDELNKAIGDCVGYNAMPVTPGYEALHRDALDELRLLVEEKIKELPRCGGKEYLSLAARALFSAQMTGEGIDDAKSAFDVVVRQCSFYEGLVAGRLERKEGSRNS